MSNNDRNRCINKGVLVTLLAVWSSIIGQSILTHREYQSEKMEKKKRLCEG